MLWKIPFIAGTLLGAGAGFGGGLYAADYEVVATASFVLSTNGYMDPAPPVPVLPPAPNCITIPADAATEVTVNATWQAGATDGTLRLDVQALSGETATATASQTGASPLSVTVDLDGADACRIAMYPDGEAVGSTSSIAIDVNALGIETVPDASPEPCN